MPYLWYYVLIASFFISCTNKNTSTPLSKINIEGFDLRFAAGGFYKHFGNADNDWAFTNSLSSEEMKLFDFNTNLSLEHTNKISLDSLIAFPNPCTDALLFYTSKPDSLVYKIVITDSTLNILKQFAIKSGNYNFEIRFNDQNQFPLGSSRRIYFSVSAKNYPDYQYGFGDIKICAEEPQSASSCF